MWQVGEQDKVSSGGGGEVGPLEAQRDGGWGVKKLNLHFLKPSGCCWIAGNLGNQSDLTDLTDS